MSFNIIKYIGDSAKRILTAQDLSGLGATESQLKSLSGNSILTFVKGAAHDVEEELARFIANHPTLAGEFHVLSDDEAKAETTVTNPISEGAGPGSLIPAGTASTETSTLPTVEPNHPGAVPVAETSPVETSTTESAVATESTPATNTIAAPPAS